MKRLGIRFIIFIAIITIFLPYTSTFATTKQRIFDDADLLTREEVKQLEEIAESASINRETNFLIITTLNEENKDITQFISDYYDDYGPGYDKEHGNTVILALDMKNRDIQLASFYKAEKYLNDYRLDQIRQKITPHLSAGDYYKAFVQFIETSDRYMDTLPSVDQGSSPGVDPGAGSNSDPDHIFFELWFQILISLGIALLVVAGMAYNTGGKVTVNHKTYQNQETSKVLQRRDRYIRTTTTRRRKPQNNSGGGSSGGGGGGRTSGGHSFSGSRGKF